MTQDIAVGIGTDNSALGAGLAAARNQIQSVGTQLAGGFTSLQGALSKVNVAFAAVTTALAGGAAFAASVSATVDWTKESERLARALGITATEASVLNVAIGDVYGSADQVITATKKIAQQLATDEAAFKRLGVATRDTTGAFRNSLDIMLAVNQRLLEFKAGTDRNIEGTKIYGKSWEEIQPVLKLTNDLLDESRAKARALGLVVGVETKENVARYRAAMNAAGDAIQAMKLAIGNALMPELTRLANWFSEVAPTAIQYTRYAIATLITGWTALSSAVQSAWATIKAAFLQMGELSMTVGEVLWKAFNFDFGGAQAAWSAGLGRMSAIGKAWLGEIGSIAKEGATRVEEAWTRAFKPGDTPISGRTGGSGGKGSSGEVKKESRMSLWEAELREAKVAFQESERQAGSFRQYSLQQERDFWASKRAIASSAAGEDVAIRSKVAEISLKIDKDAFDGRMALLKGEEELIKNNFDRKIALAMAFADRMAEAYGAESKQYQEAAKRVQDLRRQQLEQEKAVGEIRRQSIEDQAVAEIDALEQRAQLEYDLGRISHEQLLIEQRKFEAQRTQILLEGISERQALQQGGDQDPQEEARLNAERLRILRQSQSRMNALLAEQAKVSPWAGMVDGFESAMQRLVQTGLTNFRDLWSALGTAASQIGATIITELGAKPAAEMIAQWVRSTDIYKALVGAQTATQAQGSASVIASKSAETSAVVGQNAVQAGTGAAASQAAIPFIGPVLAISAAMAMLAFVRGLGGARSAAGGFDIPGGVNPLTQLHAREMVLPAEHAQTIRDLGKNGRTGGMTVHINAVDAAGFEQMLQRNASGFRKFVQAEVRSGRV